MEKRLTIIVPIYNVEKYLHECLNSFLSQTNKDFQVLLIDDGSTDSSGTIALNYCKKNPELFTYFRQENKGLGGARNTGLDLAKTEYIMFFDSDDFMANRAIDYVLKHIEKNKTDIVFFNPVIYDVALHTYVEWHDADLIHQIFSKKDIVDPSKTPQLLLTEASVCRAVWKKSFLDEVGLRFLEHTHWEDVPPHFLLMHNAKSASFLRVSGVYYYRTNTSNQITAGGGKTRMDIKRIFTEIRGLFNDNSYSRKDKVNMIGFLSKYLLWNIRVIESDYLAPFVDVCHSFLKSIHFPALKFYLTCKVGKKEKITVFLLASRVFYKKLRNREKIEKKVAFLKKIKRLIKR